MPKNITVWDPVIRVGHWTIVIGLLLPISPKKTCCPSMCGPATSSAPPC